MSNPVTHIALAFTLTGLLGFATAAAQTDGSSQDTDHAGEAVAAPALIQDANQDGAGQINQDPSSQTRGDDYRFAPPNRAAVAGALKGLVDESRWQPGRVTIDWKIVRAFYEKRRFAPAWTDERLANTVRKTLAHAGDEGLNEADYAADSINPPSNGDPQRFARFDLLLTNSLLFYARDVHQGRIAPDLAYDEIDFKPAPFDAVSGLNGALAAGKLDAYLKSLPPPQADYQALKALLARYRQIEANGGWQRLPDRHAATRETGDQSADTATDQQPRGAPTEQDSDQLSSDADSSFSEQLRERLAAENYNVEDGGDIREAVKAFQHNHDLDPTGVADRETVIALNIGVGTRIVQIEANMERWRWMPRKLEQRFIEVNVPAEHLVVMDAGNAVLTSRVVVGRESAPTPLIHSVANSITVNPVWHIPQDIAEDEILPKGKAYLHEQKIVFSSKKGTTGLRQLPGPKNALGSIKINIPNRFAIYLHDTPGKSTFARNERDESHGCVRVEKILELASVLLTGNPEQDLGNLKDTISTRRTRQLALPTPVPVYVVYWSVTPANDGSAQFWPDIYSRDQSLIAELKKRNVAERVSVL